MENLFLKSLATILGRLGRNSTFYSIFITWDKTSGYDKMYRSRDPTWNWLVFNSFHCKLKATYSLCLSVSCRIIPDLSLFTFICTLFIIFFKIFSHIKIFILISTNFFIHFFGDFLLRSYFPLFCLYRQSLSNSFHGVSYYVWSKVFGHCSL